jgi:hypothetical protein
MSYLLDLIYLGLLALVLWLVDRQFLWAGGCLGLLGFAYVLVYFLVLFLARAKVGFGTGGAIRAWDDNRFRSLLLLFLLFSPAILWFDVLRRYLSPLILRRPVDLFWLHPK